MYDPTLMYLPGGRHICCICFEAFDREELQPVEDEPGWRHDVCKRCWVKENPPVT